MKRKITALTAGALATALAVPALAQAQDAEPTIVDIVLDVSGPPGSGTDDNGADYDILREALVATDLVGAVADPNADLTVFAPTDRSFIKLAQDLGFDGSDEGGALSAILAATGFESAAAPGILADVLLYHVSPGAKNVRELRRTNPVVTLLDGATLDVRFNRVIDGDPDDRDARIRSPRNLEASNGIIQTVDRVLRPSDIDAPPPPTQTIADIVLDVSGPVGSGTDGNGADYDILREALVATDLVGAVADPNADLTVFAPTDAAFIKLAQDLGYEGDDEGEALSTIVAATSEDDLLRSVLLYHVAPGGQTVRQLNFLRPVETLQGSNLRLFLNIVIDADFNDRDARIVAPSDLAASNGIIQTVARVLRPIDLP